MTSDKPSDAEEEYFAKEEAEKKKRLHEKLKAEIERERRDASRRYWFMTCPKCGATLEGIVSRGILVEKCLECGGVWLDAGELDTLAGKEDHSLIADIIKLFTPK